VAVDVGANVGAFTVLWGRHMMGWGSVHAFECQERIFYALAGNIACLLALLAVMDVRYHRDGTPLAPRPRKILG
jgi:FkbM family methyltransferase